MNLVLLAEHALEAHYGANEAAAIRTAVDALLVARAAAGIVSLCYDPVVGLPDLAVAPAALSEAALVNQVRAIDAALRSRGAAIASLLIIGGAALVPFGRLASPLADRDGLLVSDCVYALAGTSLPLSAWAVGRMPDADPPLPGLLLSQLLAARDEHRQPKAPSTQLIGFSSAHWRTVSREALRSAPEVQMFLAPPATAATLAELPPPRLLVCNVHGVREAAAWYGQEAATSEYTAVFRPADAARLPPTKWFSQACYGARIARVGDQPTIAAALLLHGVTTLICALGLTYGAIELPLGESDLLVAGFVAALQQPGISVGATLRSAQAEMVRSALSTRGRLDSAEIKTLLSFMLYGDPTLEV